MDLSAIALLGLLDNFGNGAAFASIGGGFLDNRHNQERL